MGSTFAPSSASVEVRTLDDVRPRPAKAGLSSDHVGPSLRVVMADAIVGYYGSVKATALTLGNVDPSLMQREFKDGKFGRFDEHADTFAKAAVSQALRIAFGDTDPKAAAIRMLDQLYVQIEAIKEVLR